MISILHATYLSDYRIQLDFNNGRSGEVDLKEVITHDHRPIFKELKDINAFKKFKVEFDTLVWSNELDMAPEYLYFQAFKSDQQLQDRFKERGYIT